MYYSMIIIVSVYIYNCICRSINEAMEMFALCRMRGDAAILTMGSVFVCWVCIYRFLG